ncbi:FAD-dependent oxidoreductase [Bordetella bronchiseptica]|uniref:FAD-dependent oxidoreductase n=1 Tax=Bordetella bronchiseptica TaxID=518 RepID=UPI00143E4379|nr:FAD-dependent oxidoreductase [Bordetella bronchiseptica]QIX99898.1 FAD-dependent oxidoreductase [Bordetella bronchiseptica]
MRASTNQTLQLDRRAALPALARSYWFKQAVPQESAPQGLRGRHSVDIAIVGGGFVGLWTALAAKAMQPTARVMVLERDLCGGGASGRNGGFAMSWWPKISTLLSMAGRDEALRLALASERAIGELERFCLARGVDAHFVRGGWFWTATTEAQRGAWASTLQACQRVGHQPFTAVAPDELARRTGSPVHLEGIFDTATATVQPALLARGLRQAALDDGIEVYEGSAVRTLHTGAPAVLGLDEAEVRAGTVVLANNVWAAAIPELAPLITPVNSALVVTEPIGERLQGLGWRGNEAITDSQLLVGYYRKTRDGRLVFGKGSGALSSGGRIGQVFSRDPGTEALTEADFRRTYPELRDVAIAQAWAGPIDRTYDSLPVFGRLRGADHICYGIGWSGNGVAPSWVGGQILASLALDRKNEWSESALVGRECRKFPPEPIRFMGGTLVRNAVLRKERDEALGRKPAWLDTRLATLAPAGLEDKS